MLQIQIKFETVYCSTNPDRHMDNLLARFACKDRASEATTTSLLKCIYELAQHYHAASQTKQSEKLL